MQKNLLSPCAALVQKHDMDRFLLSMFAPHEAREDLWALLAFNHEISKTREVVSDSNLGHIRLQWWRDAINGIYEGRILGHEVVQPLAKAIQAHHLPREHFETLLYAREFDLEDVLPANLEGLMNYADFTTSPLLKLAVQICGGNPDTQPVQPIAINYALMGILRAIPFHAVQGRCYLPENILQKHRLDRDNFMSNRDALSNATRDVMVAFVPKIRPECQFLKVNQMLAEIYYRQIKFLEYDTLSQKMQSDPPFKVLRLMMGVKFM